METIRKVNNKVMIGDVLLCEINEDVLDSINLEDIKDSSDLAEYVEFFVDQNDEYIFTTTIVGINKYNKYFDSLYGLGEAVIEINLYFGNHNFSWRFEENFEIHTIKDKNDFERYFEDNNLGNMIELINKEYENPTLDSKAWETFFDTFFEV